MVLFNPYLIRSYGDKGVHTFLMVSLKVNVIARLEFELAYYDVATPTLPELVKCIP